MNNEPKPSMYTILGKALATLEMLRDYSFITKEDLTKKIEEINREYREFVLNQKIGE